MAFVGESSCDLALLVLLLRLLLLLLLRLADGPFNVAHQNVPAPAPIKLGTLDHTSLPSYRLLLQLGSGI